VCQWMVWLYSVKTVEEGNKIIFLSEWCEFHSVLCLEGKYLMSVGVSMLLKSRASLTCFRECLLSGWAKDRKW
jgi:hypothetical protein